MTSSALHTSLSYYSAYVSAPPVVFGVWLSTVILAVVSLAWKCVKGWKEGKGAFLFDAAGLCESLEAHQRVMRQGSDGRALLETAQADHPTLHCAVCL